MFNHVEHTVVYDHLNYMTHEHLTKKDGFLPKFLCNPMPLVDGNDHITWSDSATFECGTIHRSDIVYLTDNTVAEVMDFWQLQSTAEIVVRVVPASN